MAVWPFSRAAEALRTLPAVISATSADQLLMTAERLDEIVDSRSEPLTLVDLAMPPDFPTPRSAKVTYIPIDDVAARAARRHRTAEVDDLVAGAASEAWRRYESADRVGPVIARLYRSADGLVKTTVERFAAKLSNPADVKVLQQAVHTMARSLLSQPVGRIHQAERPGEVASLVAEVFGVDE